MMSDEVVYAVIGIIGGLITFLQKVLYGELKNVYGMVVKLIDRMNKSDERREVIADENAESADRRFEKVTASITSIDKEISYLKGREDGKTK
jgi:hypothetical protein